MLRKKKNPGKGTSEPEQTTFLPEEDEFYHMRGINPNPKYYVVAKEPEPASDPRPPKKVKVIVKKRKIEE